MKTLSAVFTEAANRAAAVDNAVSYYTRFAQEYANNAREQYHRAREAAKEAAKYLDAANLAIGEASNAAAIARAEANKASQMELDARQAARAAWLDNAGRDEDKHIVADEAANAAAMAAGSAGSYALRAAELCADDDNAIISRQAAEAALEAAARQIRPYMVDLYRSLPIGMARAILDAVGIDYASSGEEIDRAVIEAGQ